MKLKHKNTVYSYTANSPKLKSIFQAIVLLIITVFLFKIALRSKILTVIVMILLSILSLQYIRLFNIYIGIELYTFCAVFATYYHSSPGIGLIIAIFGMALGEISVNKFSLLTIVFGFFLGSIIYLLYPLSAYFSFSILGIFVTILYNLWLGLILFIVTGSLKPNHILFIVVNLLFNIIIFNTFYPLMIFAFR